MNDYLKEKRKQKIKILIIQISIIILFISIWEILSKYKVINSFLFSSPIKIWNILIQYVKSGEIFKHIGISVFETVISIIIGTSVGLLVAVSLWFFPFIQKILSPFLIVFNALPKTALAPIIIIWVGTNTKGIVVVAISIFIIMTVISLLNSFNQVDEEKIKLLRSFNATKFQIMTKLIIPANFTNIISLIKINIGMSWVGVIVAEFLVSKAGLGYLIMYGSQVFKMDLVMMGVMVLAVMSFIMLVFINKLEKLLFKRK